MDIVIAIFEYVSLAIGFIAFLIILWGVIKGVVVLAAANLSRNKKPDSLKKVRYDLGYHLLVALEFLIAADIIRTIIKPTLEELGILGAIVAIRVVLSYFLHREVDQKVR